MRRRTPEISAQSRLAAFANLEEARIAVIRAEYNAEITRSLEAKCLAGLQAGGIKTGHIECFAVPGCFEIPLLAQKLAARHRYSALIALGAVIKGETLHFELVANECARGVMNVALEYQVPVIFEVLAVRTRRDAERRAGNNRMNKGFEAARAALAMLAALNQVKD
ncbi:MAG: 6,7-dimethyl-8-ribityllumazine synthase [Terriglobia bacterium]